MSLFFKCLVLPSAMCTLLTLFLTAVCSGPWYFHFTRLWKEARTGACLEGMHRATAASACRSLAGDVGEWGRWVPFSVESWGPVSMCFVQRGSCSSAVALKRQLADSWVSSISEIRNPSCHWNVLTLKNTAQAQWSMLWVRLDHRAASLQTLDEDHRGWGRLLRPESWLYHVLSDSGQRHLSKPQFPPAETNGGTDLHLRVQDT